MNESSNYATSIGACMQPTLTIKDRLECRCVCSLWGRLIGTKKFDKDGKQICRFLCSCDNPRPDFENPFELLD